MFLDQQGVASWKYFVIYYELVEKEKTFEHGCAEERICFCQVYCLCILEGFDIKNWIKNPRAKEHEIKLKKHIIHQIFCRHLYHTWKVEYV